MKCQTHGCKNEAKFTFIAEIYPNGEFVFNVEIYLCEYHYLECFEIDIYNESITENEVLNNAVLAPSILN